MRTFALPTLDPLARMIMNCRKIGCSGWATCKTLMSAGGNMAVPCCHLWCDLAFLSPQPALVDGTAWACEASRRELQQGAVRGSSI